MVKLENLKGNIRPGFEHDIKSYITQYKALLRAIGKL